MATYLNNSSGAGAGTAVGRDPDLGAGAAEEVEVIGGIHDLLSGGRAQDFITTKRTWSLKWTALSTTQWVTNIKAFLTTNSQLYYQGPEMAAKVAVLLQGKAKAVQVKLNGDTATTTHWTVTLTLLEA